ncbi:patatin-like phospholipase family protein [Hyphomonas oceanitis]|uniref:Putative esterase of the alpha-beta hydrolase superfamily protein n=1 Tax=Hyphomonas oceanitis SCH89 TaxID=1280953 RepID=A0A059G2S6_9PROT|nr:patatin-like phospholipase family protein [Hyphomonas oceanitis]KDA00778.1 putative esterase of the alpha-beta hydrolase superfamily protein [Hyphomonas oceanitis SCH89]
MKKVSVAFQGGGARIFDLIAAANALDTLQREDKLRVTRVAGTSAGAIAAAAFSCGAKFTQIPVSGPKIGALIAKRLPQKKLAKANVIISVLRNRPLYRERDVISLITEIFGLLGVDSRKPIRDCMANQKARCKELRIMASRLDSASPYQFTEQSDLELNRALVDSAGLPFIFKLPGKNTNSINPHLVDGGLFQNLPGEAATLGLSDDVVPIAVRFPDMGDIDIQSKAPLEYLGYILSRMIDARTNEAALLFEEQRIVTIQSKMSSLSFDQIIGDDFEDAYEQSFKSAYKEIERAVTADENVRKNYYDSTPKSLVGLYRSFQSEVKEFAENGHEFYSYKAREVRIIYHVNSLINEEFPDTIRTIFKLDGKENTNNEGLQNETQFQYLPIFFHNTNKCTLAPPTVEATIISKQSGNETSSQDMPVLTLPLQSKHKDYQTMILMMQRPLPKTCSVVISQNEECIAALEELKDLGRDYLYFSTQNNQHIEKMTFELHLPEKDKSGHLIDFVIRPISQKQDKHIVKAYAPNPKLRPIPTISNDKPVSGLLKKYEATFEQEAGSREANIYMIAVERIFT